MKKMCFLAVCIALLSPSLSFAEVKAGPHWGGIFEVQLSYLDNFEDQYSDADDQMSFWSGYFTLDMEVNLVDNVDLLASLKFEQVLGTPYGVWNTPDSNSDFQTDTVALQRLQIVFGEFLFQPVTLSVGRQTDGYFLVRDQQRFAYTGALLFDTYELTAHESADGFNITVDMDNIVGNAFSYTYGEATPSTAQFGNIAADNFVTGFHVSYFHKNDDNKKIYALLLNDRRGGPGSNTAYMNGVNNAVATNAWTIDVGAKWEVFKNFIVYGQVAANIMGVHWVDNGNNFIDDDDERFDTAGTAIQLGVNYQMSKYIVWLQLDIISGDDAGSEDYEGFLAPAESQALTMIVEGSNGGNCGYNRNTNVNAIRAGCSAALTQKLELNAVIGNYTEIEDETPLGQGIGSEVDLSVTWFYTDSVFFNAGLGFFFPDSDYPNDDMVMAGYGKISASF